MTVKELYEWAKENGVENEPIVTGNGFGGDYEPTPNIYGKLFDTEYPDMKNKVYLF